MEVPAATGIRKPVQQVYNGRGRVQRAARATVNRMVADRALVPVPAEGALASRDRISMPAPGIGYTVFANR